MNYSETKKLILSIAQSINDYAKRLPPSTEGVYLTDVVFHLRNDIIDDMEIAEVNHGRWNSNKHTK